VHCALGAHSLGNIDQPAVDIVGLEFIGRRIQLRLRHTASGVDTGLETVARSVDKISTILHLHVAFSGTHGIGRNDVEFHLLAFGLQVCIGVVSANLNAEFKSADVDRRG
jgi:hypothetical protein